MIQAIRQEVTVQNDSVVEIHSPILKSGAHVEVIVLLKDNEPTKKKSLSAFIGTGKGSFKSPYEVDAFLQGERDKWE